MQMYACVCNLHKKSVDIYINSINKLLADFTDMCVCINLEWHDFGLLRLSTNLYHIHSEELLICFGSSL